MTTIEILTGIKNWVTGKLTLKQDTISDLATIRSGASAGATAVQPAVLNDYVNNAAYDTSTHRINFLHGQTVLAYIDASPFIVDGMVDDVRIENGYLVVDFNTASGKQDINIPLTDIFNPSNYYTKTETDELIEDTPDFVEESSGAEELVDEWGTLRTDLYQALTDAQTATTGAERVNASLSGTTLTVTNRNGQQSSANLKGDPGTTDYNALQNKPTIPDELADLAEDSTHRTVTDTEKTAWNSVFSEVATARGTSATLAARLQDIAANAGSIDFEEDNTDGFDF